MIAEDSQTPRGRPPRASERDLLAERRALRVAKSPEAALAHRAHAAEATVKTLEAHLASLQQRLIETGRAARRSAERLSQRELELRRVKQLQYAEQQERIEAEQDLHDANRRLLASDQQTQIVAELQKRVDRVERRSAELAHALDAERGARERSERALEEIRRSHAAVAAMVGEVRALAGRLRAAADKPAPAVAQPGARSPVPGRSETSATAPGAAPVSARRPEEIADALALASARLRARPQQHASAPRANPHKHSKSLIGRWRAARKQRREGQ